MLGADVVGMTSAPEAILAREQNLEYASMCIVTNYAAGMQEKVILEEVMDVSRNLNQKIRDVLITIPAML